MKIKCTPIVIIDRAQQIGEYKWDAWQECLTCTEQTTIKEIRDWVKLRTGFDGPHNSCKIVFAEILESEV